MTDDNIFERLHFFPGMFTTADDWNDSHDYHIRRVKLHHRGLHKPGVIRGFKDELTVNGLSFENGVFKFEVCPGAAIDNDGNTIYLATIKPVSLKAPDDSPKCFYVGIRFGEKPHRFVANDVQKDYSGHTRWAEDPIVELCASKPDNLNLLALARVQLSADTTKIDPHQSGESSVEFQIDREGVQWSLSTTELEEHLKTLDNQVSDLDTRLKKEEGISASHQTTIDQHGVHLADLDARVDDHEARLTQEEDTSHTHGQRLDGLDDHVTQLGAQLMQQKEAIALLVATTAMQSVRLAEHDAGLEALDARLTVEETISAELDARVTEEEARSAELGERLEIVERKSDTLEANLGVLADFSRLHYRGSHTLGVVPQEGEHLQVKAAGGLNVRVLTGAALDRDGNTLIVSQPRTLTIDLDLLNLPQLVFIAVRYDAAEPENARLHVLAHLPADESWVELARIDLQPGVTHVSDAANPASPGGNQIDRRSVPKSGAIAVRSQGMSVTVVQRIVQIMERSRRSFADLDMQFPTPSVSDARHVCLTVETMARVGRLHLEQLADLMTTAASIEQDVSRELNTKYGKQLNITVEFEAYVRAVRSLHLALRNRDPEAILTAQDEVATAAHELSEVAIEAPIADAGDDQELITYDDPIVVTLDGSASQGRGGRSIESYRWTVSAS